MNFNQKKKNAILYLREVVDGKVRPEKLEEAKERIDELLDQSVMVNSKSGEYIINTKAKEIDLSKMDIDELRQKFKHSKYKNLDIADLREFLQKKLEQMLKVNTTRIHFAERFRKIIEAYNAGGSQNDDFYEKILKFMEELKAEEERHVKEDLSEAELEIFDLLRKEKLTKAEEVKVKLAAKELFATLTAKKNDLFITGWWNDPQPKERVKAAIIDNLDGNLPDSYETEIFELKSNIVFNHIVDQAVMGYAWVA